MDEEMTPEQVSWWPLHEPNEAFWIGIISLVSGEDDNVTLEQEGEIKEQARIFLKALQVYYNREKKYQRGWTSRGWVGNVCDILRKTARIRSMYWSRSDLNMLGDTDDVVDLINYCAFAIRNAEAGNRTGD